MTFDKKQFMADCREADACKHGLAYVQELDEEGLLEALAKAQPKWYLWLSSSPITSGYLTTELVDSCIEKEPLYALICAPKLLTPERLDYFAEKYPLYALICASVHLTPARLDWCQKQTGGPAPKGRTK